MKLIYDIGMYDGADTRYYLSEGHKVVAVEANPKLAEFVESQFEQEVRSGQLVVVNRAIADRSGQDIELHIAGTDLGSSSIYAEKITQKNPVGTHKVQTITIHDLMAEHGRPFYLKVDIEGADRHCILPLDEGNRPTYVSFEAGSDLQEMIGHLQEIGFKKFKAINQCNFCELSNQENFVFRLKRKVMHLLGYKAPQFVRLNGRYFRLCHSSGPVPWSSNGSWKAADELLTRWHRMSDAGQLGGWYDIHAC